LDYAQIDIVKAFVEHNAPLKQLSFSAAAKYLCLRISDIRSKPIHTPGIWFWQYSLGCNCNLVWAAYAIHLMALWIRVEGQRRSTQVRQTIGLKKADVACMVFLKARNGQALT
jgi:hypothetical protein